MLNPYGSGDYYDEPGLAPYVVEFRGVDIGRAHSLGGADALRRALYGDDEVAPGGPHPRALTVAVLLAALAYTRTLAEPVRRGIA